MEKADWKRCFAACAIAVLCCWLSQRRLDAGGKTALPAIHGKIPLSILKIIRTIHPGISRAQFNRLFVPYWPGAHGEGRVTAGKSSHVIHYCYRFAYVPPVEILRRKVIDSKVVSEGDEQPDTTRWKFEERPIKSGTLIIVDVRWTFSKDSSLDDSVGNPDDVIAHISKPYLIFDEGNHI